MALGAVRLSFIEGECLLKHRVRERTQIENQQHSVRPAFALAANFQGWLSIIRITVINQMQRGIMTTGNCCYCCIQVCKSATHWVALWSLFYPLTATFSHLSFLIFLRHSTLGTDRAAWLRNDVKRFIEIDSSLESKAWKCKLKRCGTFSQAFKRIGTIT